ncbi:MAG: hypothetical protein PHY16_18760 [Methylobacter sp.]|nr:hypothetical protein [Methylobacter sp.]
MPLSHLFDNLSDYIAVAAGLGTAAYALVDGSKAFWGGVSNCGFGAIEHVVKRFFPDDIRHQDTDEPLSLAMVVGTLRANWLNGTALVDQMAIAKSLIKLRLNEATAPYLAKATGVDEQGLVIIAEKIATGKTLAPDENDLLGRFDLLLTALLDKGYQRADQSYRNSAKAWSIAVSVVLAIVGGYIVNDSFEHISGTVLLGLAATPIAPVTKDLTSALSAGVKVAQALRK